MPIPRILPIALLSILLSACSGGNGSQQELPAACELLSTQQLQDILQEPVRDPEPITANQGEASACEYTLPGRAGWDKLGIYILKNETGAGPEQLKALAEEWKGYYVDAEYELLDNADYLMAWFPGEYRVYQPTLLFMFDTITLAVLGAELKDAQSIAFLVMVQYEME